LAEATHLLGLPLKHKPKDIKPQGAGSGLDADKVDGFHASEIGGGGGPHASSHETGGADKVHFADLEHTGADGTLHDFLVAAPHISQADKDRIHDRQHMLSSGSDHTGEITDSQHGSRGSSLHADSHARSHDHSLIADGSPIAVAGVPDLPASKIASGVLAAARGGLAKVLYPTWTDDYILVYDSVTDQWIMEPKPAGADHNLLSATHPDTLADSPVAGDLLIANSTPKWARLAKGSDGQFLKLVSGLPAWADHQDSDVYAIVSCRVGVVTSGYYYPTFFLVNFSDMLLNISDFPTGAKARIRVMWKNDGNYTNYMKLYDQLGAADVSGSEFSQSMSANVWNTAESSQFSLPTGLKSFMVKVSVSDGTITVAKVELQIEKGA